MSRLIFSLLFAMLLFMQGCDIKNSSDKATYEKVLNQSSNSTTSNSKTNQSQDNHSKTNNILESNLNSTTKNKSNTLNVVSPDWGVAGTLTAMGYPPIATGDIRVWHQWVGKPELPDTVIDLGIRFQPNAELVAQLPVDMVIDNYFYEHARNLYGDVPSYSLLYMSEGEVATWQDYVKPTQQLGELIYQPDAASNYIAVSQARIKQAGKKLHKRYPNVNKFAVVQFIDANNLRMYSHNSLFNVLFNMMDYEFVALEQGNEWGFVSIQLGELARLDDDVCLLVIEPLTQLVKGQLNESLVWQRLGYGSSNNNKNQHNKSRCMATLDPVWIYGGMSSIVVLADNLAKEKLVGGGI